METRRIILQIVGLTAILMGIWWFLEGLNIVGDADRSHIVGHTGWAVIGAALFASGGFLLRRTAGPRD